MNPFDLFTTTSYTFLQLQQGGAGGNRVISQTASTGVLKHRNGLVQSGNREAFDSTSTLHIRPSESFIATVGGHESLVGHGIRADGEDYRITGVVAGQDFSTGSTAFYRCTLKKESLWVSELPLE